MTVIRKSMRQPMFSIQFHQGREDFHEEAHYHNFSEVQFYLGQDPLPCLIEGRRYLLETGDFLLLPPGIVHFFPPEEVPKSAERYVLQIATGLFQWLGKGNEDFFYLFSTALLEKLYVLKTPKTTWKPFISAFAQLLFEFESTRFHALISSFGFLVHLLGHLDSTLYYHLEKIRLERSKRNALSQQISQYIYVHYKENLTLARAANDLHISKSTLTRALREDFGKSFVEMCRERRLNIVKIRLFRGIPITEAWQDAGYHDYSTFYRAFLKEFGKSPRAFLQELA